MSNNTINAAIVKSKSATLIGATMLSGILDALAAIVVYGVFFKYNPVQIYQFVASAILGDEAFSGGIPIALLGLFFHFLIAFVSSLLFIQLYPRISFLRGNSVLVGLAYGLAIWLVMNLIILPLTKIPHAPFGIVSVLAIIWHMALVGLPISIVAARHYKSISN